MQNKCWNILPYDKVAVDNLQKSLGISPAICQILVQRGIAGFDHAKDYFRPQLAHLHSPWLMKDMRQAVQRIDGAIKNKERILVFGDYDVDGTTAVAVVLQFLNKIYQHIDYYIPHRYREGYGVSKAGIDYAKDTGATLIISLDCGIKSVELVAYAHSLNIDFIVCDHHLPDTELPKAVAILNPKQKDCAYPYKELCGCGIGFKLIQALSDHWSLAADAYLQYLDLAATAIAADIVPITGENRTLAFYGLKKVNENPCVGIKALMQLSQINNRLLHINNLVFVIAPRVNAAGRMDDATKAVQLFIEQDYEKALKYAEALHSDNNDRKDADTNTTEEALAIIYNTPEFIHKKTTVVFREHWHKGVVGIVASRLIESYYRPTVVLTKNNDEIIAGSARSVRGFNLYEAVHACKEFLLGYGGHEAAAGLSLLKENLENFSRKFEEAVSSTIDEKLLIPEIVIDAEINFPQLTMAFYNIILQMEPFGPGNMRPVFLTKNVVNTGYSRIVKEKHIKFSLKQGGSSFAGIGFNLSEKFYIVENEKPFDIVFTLEINEWNNEKRLELKIIDLRQAEA
jgi:single-stranded-DNA-specific exonuclease